jgi:hypothetical protein
VTIFFTYVSDSTNGHRQSCLFRQPNSTRVEDNRSIYTHYNQNPQLFNLMTQYSRVFLSTVNFVKKKLNNW